MKRRRSNRFGLIVGLVMVAAAVVMLVRLGEDLPLLAIGIGTLGLVRIATAMS